jgi:predicted alpha/beta superfamily hydrolase
VDNDGSPLGDTEVHYLQSSAVGDEFKVFVGHCGSLGADDVPVLYVTDANGYFGTAVDIIRGMQMAAHLPPMLVVGIGYRLGGIAETVEIRQRDLTPSVDPGIAAHVGEGTRFGGADAFLEFIRAELTPWVGSRYSVAADDATIFGHSLGGLFANYALLTKPESFRRYIIGSPSLWWSYGDIFGLEATYSETHTDLPAQVYFGVGSEEDQDGRARQLVNLSAEEQAYGTSRYIDMVSDTQRMIDALRSRGYPSLTIDSDVFADEFHVTVASLILSRGLRRLFDAPR